jgi:hypothetical protein
VHLKVKDWKKGWTGESVMPRGSAIKLGADAFIHLQVGEHNPEVIIIYSNGSACLMHASQPSPAVVFHAPSAGVLQLLGQTFCTEYWLLVSYPGCYKPIDRLCSFSALLT